MEYSDNDIIEGLKKRDGQITRSFFYGYCHLAYYIFNDRYGLFLKPGMDFYSIAHEYYLKLAADDFRQLENRSEGVSLKTWMANGFRFIVLDRLKSYARTHRVESLEERMSKPDLRFDIVDGDYSFEVRKVIEEVCDNFFGRDDKTAIVLKMILVEGFKGKEVAQQLGMTPSAVTQRYRKAMDEVVVPYFKSSFRVPYYGAHIPMHSYGATEDSCQAVDFSYNECDNINKSHFNDNYRMEQRKINTERITPTHISQLGENEIFVFGSNLQGMHGGGAARTARLYFGAVMGQGTGRQGQCYAIPTMQGGVETIIPYVNQFLDYAKSHPELQFLVTPIGCGIAGFTPEEIAPLFAGARYMDNVSLPLSFWEELKGGSNNYHRR